MQDQAAARFALPATADDAPGSEILAAAIPRGGVRVGDSRVTGAEQLLTKCRVLVALAVKPALLQLGYDELHEVLECSRGEELAQVESV